MRLTQLRIRYARLAAEPGGGAFRAPWELRIPTILARPEWRPPCDVYDTVDARTVRIEIAGVEDDALEVLLYEDSLVVRGDRPWGCPSPEAHILAAELRYGRFELAVEVPPDVDRTRAAARYERGILTVVLPRAEERR